MKRSLALLSLTALALTACQPAGGGTIKIGYIGPLTGDAASYGVDTLNGVKMKIEEINAAGGINGRQIEIVAEDGKCTGSEAASAAQKLVNVDKVIAIVGGQCSGETLAAAPIAEEGKVVIVSPVSSSPDVTKAGDYVFRDYPSDALKTKAMAKYFAEEKITKVAMISENTDFASAFRASLKENLPADAVVFDEVVEPGTKDFRTLMTRLKNVKFDTFFPNAQSDATMAAMMQQFRDQGMKQPAISHDIADSVTLAKLAPEAVEGMWVINVPTSGQGTSFETDFTAKYGAAQATIAFAAHAYDAAGVIAEALKAGATDGTAIKDWLYNMKEYKGVVGAFSFDRNGDVVGVPYGLKQFQKGVIRQVKGISVD
ncbi:ABC transporter substrate-binding protein [Candidatus Peregrinibacteria bacterium]|nr:ABC transporter substrate-binding protein [Candidatus Peregrinibacteria bacterium]